jgi:hypothetical protein
MTQIIQIRLSFKKQGKLDKIRKYKKFSKNKNLFVFVVFPNEPLEIGER